MPQLTGSRIRHAVAFRLQHAAGSPAEADFLQALTDLGALPGVEAFEVLQEVSPKNDFRLGVSMEFADTAAYDAYNSHPQHVSFVEERWKKEVTDFLEIDFVSRPRD